MGTNKLLKMNIKIFILFNILALVCSEKRVFNGFKVYNVIPRNDGEVKILADIEKNGIGEFWSDHSVVDEITKIMVSPEKQTMFRNELNKVGMEANEVIPDVQRLINEQLRPPTNRNSESFFSYSWDRYYDLEAIYAWLDELAAAYPDIVEVISMGRSVENRDIRGIKINYNRNFAQVGVLEGTLHAREWISAATVTWIIKEFLTSTDPAVRAMAESNEWHIFPVVNPDGYSYTFTHNRMWRKNRSTANFTSCAASGAADDMSNGVDLNRNFDFQWMSIGASDNPCTNTFAGPTPFSEPETRAIAQYVRNLRATGHYILYYIAFHSYTQLIITPYSHVGPEEVLAADNYGNMYEIGIRAADKIAERYGTHYRVGISANVMYPMSGASFDWVKYEANVPVTYLIELRDLGEYGFLLPPEQIIPNNLETMDGLVEMDRTTRQLGYYSFVSGASSTLYSLSLIVFGLLFVLYN